MICTSAPLPQAQMQRTRPSVGFFACGIFIRQIMRGEAMEIIALLSIWMIYRRFARQGD